MILPSHNTWISRSKYAHLCEHFVSILWALFEHQRLVLTKIVRGNCPNFTKNPGLSGEHTLFQVRGRRFARHHIACSKIICHTYNKHNFLHKYDIVYYLIVFVISQNYEAGSWITTVMTMTLNFGLYWWWCYIDSALKRHYRTLRDTAKSVSPHPQYLRLAITSSKTWPFTKQFQLYFQLLDPRRTCWYCFCVELGCMLLLIWTAFRCLMAAAGYQLYPPVIVLVLCMFLCILTGGERGLVVEIEVKWQGRHDVSGMIGRTSWLLQDTVEQRILHCNWVDCWCPKAQWLYNDQMIFRDGSILELDPQGSHLILQSVLTLSTYTTMKSRRNLSGLGMTTSTKDMCTSLIRLFSALSPVWNNSALKIGNLLEMWNTMISWWYFVFCSCTCTTAKNKMNNNITYIWDTFGITGEGQTKTCFE